MRLKTSIFELLPIIVDRIIVHRQGYVDLSRMLPVEESVPKSVSIIGQIETTKTLSFQIFLEYSSEISVDVLTGNRV